MSTVTVLTGPERRRRWTASEKLRIVEESAGGTASVAEVARRHDVHPNLLHLWRRQARAGASSAEPGGQARFVPVAVAPGNGVAPPMESRSGSTIEVVLRNGRVLRLPDGVAPTWVAGLADALEGNAR
ncbi:MAG: transposase [Xanthobacteraceae bacterium]|jgi:transposase